MLPKEDVIRGKDFGVREVRAAVMQGVVEEFVSFLISDAAATYLEKDLGLTAADQVTPALMDEAMVTARIRVMKSLTLNEDDSPDRHRYAELVARSLGGFGDRIASDVLTVNDGDLRLVALQGAINTALARLPS